MQFGSKMFYNLIIATAILIVQQFCGANAAPLPGRSSVDLLASDGYSSHPNEVLPIQPVLLYPKARELRYQGRNLIRDDDVIYVKLLKRKSYRPKKTSDDESASDVSDAPRELTMKDIFYVKALANGQFSHQRVKWYRLPEFYAISVYHKGATV